MEYGADIQTFRFHGLMLTRRFFYICRTERANTAPAVTWNSGFSYTGLNSVGGSPFSPYVAAERQGQLPWLHKVVLFPPISSSAISFNGFPAGLLRVPCAGVNFFHGIDVVYI